MTKENNEPRANRFFDDGDFTSEHDEMDIALVNGGWEALCEALFGAEEDSWFEGEYDAEPPLEGYPTVYPDAVISDLVRFSDHQGSAVVLRFQPYDVDGTWVHCSRCRCFIKEVRYKDPPKPTDVVDWHAWHAGREARRAAKWQELVTTLRVAEPCQKRLPTVCVEIKPTVDSFGKVLRQLNIYRKRLEKEGAVRVVLVTNDDRYDGAFDKQRVFVYHPPRASE